MRYLADTHILLWALADDPQLPNSVRDILLDESVEIYYSFANVWEVAIKHSMNKANLGACHCEQSVNFCSNG